MHTTALFYCKIIGNWLEKKWSAILTISSLAGPKQCTVQLHIQSFINLTI
jgi:hypothetical protein